MSIDQANTLNLIKPPLPRPQPINGRDNKRRNTRGRGSCEREYAESEQQERKRENDGLADEKMSGAMRCVYAPPACATPVSPRVCVVCRLQRTVRLRASSRNQLSNGLSLIE